MKKNTLQFLLSSILILNFLNPVYSQTKDSIQSHNALAEKIYIQTTKDVYSNDETLWFKTTVASAAGHYPTFLSKVLYVELIDKNEKVVEKKIIKIENGVGDGFFNIYSYYPSGTYLLRAYTQWNKNFDDNFVSKKYIRVFSEKQPPLSKEILTDITLKRSEGKAPKLTAVINPQDNSNFKRKLPIYLDLDGKKDTLLIKKDQNNQYKLEYGITEESKSLKVGFVTRDNKGFLKTISLDNEYIDLSFFPESGDLVAGLGSTVGFKSLDAKGKGKTIEGDIIDQNGKVITTFKSNELGMGTFKLSNISETDSYFASIKSALNSETLKIPLPKVTEKGNVLNVQKKNGILRASFASNYMKNDEVTLYVSGRGYVYEVFTRPLRNGRYTFNIPDALLPEGIYVFTVKDSRNIPMVERLYFNKRLDKRLEIDVVANKDSYNQREQTQLVVETKNGKGEPIASNTSVLVMSKNDYGKMQSTRENILTYFLLSSDLKGKIETPGYYFTKGTDEDLDALLLTQGWRKYNYIEKLRNTIYEPELSLTVSGIIKNVDTKKKEKEIELMLMAIGEDKPSVFTTTAEVPGNFEFTLGDIYGDQASIVVQDVNKKKKDKTRHSIVLKKQEAPKIHFDHTIYNDEIGTIERTIIEKKIRDKKRQDNYVISKKGFVSLDEVRLEATTYNARKQGITQKYGVADYVISGEEIQKKDKKWSYGLYSVLMYNFANKITINRDRRTGQLNATAVGSYKGGKTLVMIDGIPVQNFNYQWIQYIPPREVVSFEVIEQAKNYKELYGKAFPESMANLSMIPIRGDVISIYTRAGKGLFGALENTEGISVEQIPVFAVSREFYTPKYKGTISEDEWAVPDTRSIIYWNPNVVTDKKGKASLNYFNSDVTGDMLVVVEGINAKGEVGYKVVEYNVKEKK